MKPDGSKQFRRLYKKNASRYNLYTLKTEKTYGHIPDLQALILRKRLTGGGMPRRRLLRPDDPRRFGLFGTNHRGTPANPSQERSCYSPQYQHSRQIDEQQCPPE